MKRKKPFYPEYMTKRQPTVPRRFYRTTIDWLLGIMSPSLVFMAGADEEAARTLEEFNYKHRKYMCWKRQLSREGWKTLYRQERLRQQYPPEGADHDRGREKNSGNT
nr:MAG TPA: hypothetical protein [Caudoviricetes sp.]